MEVYLPSSSVWYDYYNHEKYDSPGKRGEGRYVTLDAPLDTIPVLVRGGTMLVRKKMGAKNTAER